MRQIVITDYIGFCIAHLHLSGKSVSNERYYYLSFERWLKDKPLNEFTIQEFILSLKDRALSNSHINHYINFLRHLAKYLITKRLATDDFIKNFKAFPQERPLIEVLFPHQIQALVETSLQYGVFHGKNRTVQLNLLHQTMILFLAVTGCRYNEMASIQIKDIDIEQGKVNILRTKNKHPRVLYVYEPLVGRMKQLIEGKTADDYLFTTSLGNKVRGQEFNKILKQYAKVSRVILKWQTLHAHIFRHSFITELLKRGVALPVVAALAGHQDIQSTNYYFKQLEDVLRAGLAHHPLIKYGIEAQWILKQCTEVIKSFEFQEDSRFGYKIEEGNNSLSFTLFIK